MTEHVAEEPPSAHSVRRPLRIEAAGAHELHLILECWRAAAAALSTRPRLSRKAREVINCQRALCDEMFEWIQRGGRPPGELRVARANGLPQAIAALEPLPRSLFVHYLVSAPWNALTADDVSDLRTMRGAGSALIADAVEQSAAMGLGGFVSLEAINERCRATYEHLGFVRPAELAGIFPQGLYGAAESATRCWMLLDGRRARRPRAA